MERVGSQQNVFHQVSWGLLVSLEFLLWPECCACEGWRKGVYGSQCWICSIAQGPISVRDSCEQVSPPKEAGLCPCAVALCCSPSHLRFGLNVSPASTMIANTRPTVAPWLLYTLWFLHLFLSSHENHGMRLCSLLWVLTVKIKPAASHALQELVPPCPGFRSCVALAQPQERKHPWGMKSEDGRFLLGFPPPWNHAGCLPFEQKVCGESWPDSQPTKSD